MTLDLSHARTIAEQFMIDRCVVTRDPQGTLDDTLNNTTLEYEDNPSDSTVIYGGTTGGPCLWGPPQRRDTRNDEGGQDVYRRGMRVRFPVSAPRYLAGDIVVMVASLDPRSNPQLVGQMFRVIEPDDRSLAASRMVIVEDEKGVAPRR